MGSANLTTSFNGYHFLVPNSSIVHPDLNGTELFIPGMQAPHNWSTRSRSDDLSTLLTIHNRLDAIVPAVLSLGITGNILVACVFMLSPLKKNALSHYLTALAIADIIHLVANMVTWVSQHGWNIYNKIGVCQLTTFALLTSQFLTIWYLLSAHVERVLIHYSRPGSKRWCTVFRAKCIILTVFILSVVAFLHYIWSHVVVWHFGAFMCLPMQESLHHINRLRRVEVIMALFLPMTIMVGLDGALFYKIISQNIHSSERRASARNRISLRAKRSSSQRNRGQDGVSAENGEIKALASPKDTCRNGESTREEKSEQETFNLSKEKARTTLVCILVGLCFIVLTLPSACIRARVSFFQFEANGKPPLNPYEIHLTQIFEQIVLYNGVYKVVVYVACLRTFRRAIVHLFTRCVRKGQHSTAQSAVTTV